MSKDDKKIYLKKNTGNYSTANKFCALFYSTLIVIVIQQNHIDWDGA